MKSLAIIATGIIMMILVAASPDNENPAASGSEIQFKSGTWKDILALAKKENKPIFLDISASWCGYCKRMKANVFTDIEVGKLYNSTFINVAVDGEKGDGVELAKKYGVKGYPTFVFLNPDRSLAYQTSGYHDSNKFLKLGKDAISK